MLMFIKKILLLLPAILSLLMNQAFADSVTAANNSQVIVGQSLVDAAVSAITQRTGTANDTGNVTITPLYRPQDVLVPPGKVDVTVVLPYGVRYNVPTVANAILTVDGQMFSKVDLRFDVKLYKDVLVTAQSIAPGEIITLGSLRYVRMDVGKIASGYFNDANKVAGLMSRRPLAQGVVLNEYMLAKPTVIKHGTTVVIVARVGDLEVTAPGQALQDGCIGQVVRVQNTNSKKIISARVLDENSVLAATINRK